MKLLSTALLFLLTFLNDSQPQIETSDRESFYFLEATCSKCDIEAEGIGFNHYVITTPAPVRETIDETKLTSEFKELLKQKFSNAELLFENIVIRKSHSKKKLERLRNNYREKYLKKGYHVKLLSE